MIEEQDYKWFPPSQNFRYTGYPIPRLDIQNKSAAVIKKEDVAYLGDWMKELKCSLYYGYRNSGSVPNLNNDYFRTEVWHKYPLTYLDDACKHFYCLSVGTSYNQAGTGYLCPFTLGGQSWDDYWAPLTAWQGHKRGQYDYTYDFEYGYQLVPKPASRLLSTSLSDVYTPSRGYPPGLSNLTQYNFYHVTARPNADFFRKLYYDMNRLSCAGYCTTQIEYTSGEIIDHSIKGMIWRDHPWTGSYSNTPIRGPWADDSYVYRHIDKYLSGDYISSDVKQLTCTWSSGGYVPYGQPSHAIYNNFSWTDVTQWGTGRYEPSPSQSITYYTNTGNPHYIVCPMLKGKIKRLGVWEVMYSEHPRWSYSGSDPYDYYYAFRFRDLTKVSDHEGYECWEDTSGYWNDSQNMMSDLKNVIVRTSGKGSNLYSYSGSRTNMGAFFFQLDTGEWKYYFDGWNWHP